MSYEVIIEYFPNYNFPVIIAGNGEKFFICFKDKANYRYSRHSAQGTVISQSLDYIAIGAKKYKTLAAAKKYAKKLLTGE